MRRWTLAVLVLAALSGFGSSGCGMGRGIRGRVVDSSGKGIPCATVSIVVLPPGGGSELARRADAGESLWGWHFTTDSKGCFRLDGIPTGGMVVAGYTPPQVYTTTTNSSAQGSAYGAGGWATGSAYGRSTSQTVVPGQVQYAYKPGEWLGFVVRAPGYRPYVSTVYFGSPTGTMDTISLQSGAPPSEREAVTLRESGAGKLDIVGRDGLNVSLEPEGRPDANTERVDPAKTEKATQNATHTRAVPIPAGGSHLIREYLANHGPSWGGGDK